uniref:Ring finger domain n=1 Tax=Glypta fumiferanae TaxID=389681 RepID=A0A0F6QA78_9HYME|nr:ring finger domain [Glypta fumiferanae]
MSITKNDGDTEISGLSSIRMILCTQRAKIIATLERTKRSLENEIVTYTAAIAEKVKNAETTDVNMKSDESEDKALQSAIQVYHEKISLLQRRVMKIDLDINIETSMMNLDQRYNGRADDEATCSYWVFDNFCPICRSNKSTRNSIAFTVPCGHDICDQCFNDYMLHVSNNQGSLICPGCRTVVESVLLVQLDEKKGLRNSLSVRTLYERRNLLETLLPQAARSIVEIWRFSSIRRGQ